MVKLCNACMMIMSRHSRLSASESEFRLFARFNSNHSYSLPLAVTVTAFYTHTGRDTEIPFHVLSLSST